MTSRHRCPDHVGHGDRPPGELVLMGGPPFRQTSRLTAHTAISITEPD